MPTRARLTFSQPGAPSEPQRTQVTIGVTSPMHALPLRVAAASGLLGQEALEPRLVDVAAHHAVPLLVAMELDAAVIDLATFLGERALGWDGLAIGVFGPVAADRSVGVAVVETATWERRRDTCERLVRACVRALALAAADPSQADAALTRSGVAATEEIAAAALAGWWPDLVPAARELSRTVRWDDSGRATRALRGGLAWTRPGTLLNP